MMLSGFTRDNLQLLDNGKLMGKCLMLAGDYLTQPVIPRALVNDMVSYGVYTIWLRYVLVMYQGPKPWCTMVIIRSGVRSGQTMTFSKQSHRNHDERIGKATSWGYHHFWTNPYLESDRAFSER